MWVRLNHNNNVFGGPLVPLFDQEICGCPWATLENVLAGPWAPLLDHAGGPGVVNLLALPNHTLTAAKLLKKGYEFLLTAQ